MTTSPLLPLSPRSVDGSDNGSQVLPMQGDDDYDVEFPALIAKSMDNHHASQWDPHKTAQLIEKWFKDDESSISSGSNNDSPRSHQLGSNSVASTTDSDEETVSPNRREGQQSPYLELIEVAERFPDFHWKTECPPGSFYFNHKATK